MFYNLVVRPVLFRLDPELTHELAIQYLIWTMRFRQVWWVLKDFDYWIVVLTAFSIGMLAPARWRLAVIEFWIDVAIALREALPRI